MTNDKLLWTKNKKVLMHILLEINIHIKLMGYK